MRQDWLKSSIHRDTDSPLLGKRQRPLHFSLVWWALSQRTLAWRSWQEMLSGLSWGRMQPILPNCEKSSMSSGYIWGTWRTALPSSKNPYHSRAAPRHNLSTCKFSKWMLRIENKQLSLQVVSINHSLCIMSCAFSQNRHIEDSVCMLKSIILILWCLSSKSSVPHPSPNPQKQLMVLLQVFLLVDFCSDGKTVPDNLFVTALLSKMRGMPNTLESLIPHL